MTLRCKPGDLAFVISAPACPELLGRIVVVLYTEPSGDYTLPDGFPASNTHNGEASWVVELQRPVQARLMNGRSRLAKYGAMPDSLLRPIRPDAEPESIVRELETT